MVAERSYVSLKWWHLYNGCRHFFRNEPPRRRIATNPRNDDKRNNMNDPSKLYRLETTKLPTYRMKHESVMYSLYDKGTHSLLCSSLDLTKIYAYCFDHNIPRESIEIV